jgi:hypothetical protein
VNSGKWLRVIKNRYSAKQAAVCPVQEEANEQQNSVGRSVGLFGFDPWNRDLGFG